MNNLCDESSSAEKMKLYSEDSVFQFYSKSKDLPPGTGRGEKMPLGSGKKFAELAKIKDWRKKLSNFWIAEMEIDGLRWSSVEHFYHANKYKNNEPTFYRKFSLSYQADENEPDWIEKLPSDMAVNPGVAKSLGGKTGRYRGVSYRPSHVILDDGFFEDGNSEKVMERGQEEKYMQHEDLQEMLLATKNAKLLHFTRGGPIVFHDTMRIRQRLKEGASKEDI